MAEERETEAERGGEDREKQSKRQTQRQRWEMETWEGQLDNC